MKAWSATRRISLQRGRTNCKELVIEVHCATELTLT